MKKAGLVAIAILSVATTFAKTTTPTKNTAPENQKMKELDSCIRSYNSERAIAKHAMIRGKFKISKADYATADADKKHVKAIAALLKSEGVRHPLILAHREIRNADKKMIVADVKIVKADKMAKRKAMNAGDSIAVKATENNLIVDKNKLKNDISAASHDEMKHFVLIRS